MSAAPHAVTGSRAWLLRGGPQLYLLVNLAFLLLVGMLAATGVDPNPRLPYLILLFAACSTPLLFDAPPNGRYLLLTSLLGCYFLLYAGGDLAALLPHRQALIAPDKATGFLGPAELAILLGAVCANVGYMAGVGWSGGTQQRWTVKDWKLWSIVTLGLLLWTIGTSATWYWQVIYYKTATESNKDLGPVAMLMLVLARLVLPLGSLLLGYALAISRNRSILALALATVAIQMIVGFLGDTKQNAMAGGALIILAYVMVTGKVPKLWLLGFVLFLMLAFPVFEGYRSAVLQTRGLTRAQAAANMVHNLQIAIEASRKNAERSVTNEERNPSFLERINSKPTIEMLFRYRFEYQRGYTLMLFFTGFVPRLVWDDKPGSSIGQLFNRAFHVSEDPDTYIAPTDLGELYWNFGWLGIVCGMLGIGALLGRINRWSDISQTPSVTRCLILASTIYAACLRFEGSIALEYIVWIRTLGAIGILHLLFARVPVVPRGAAPAAAAPQPPPGERPGGLAANPRYPNLLT